MTLNVYIFIAYGLHEFVKLIELPPVSVLLILND